MTTSFQNKNLSKFDVSPFKFFGDEMMDMMFTTNFKLLLEVMKDWEEYQEYIPRYELFIETYKDTLKKIYEPTSNFNILNHGDHHTKNLLFKMNDSQVEDVCIVSHFFKWFEIS